MSYKKCQIGSQTWLYMTVYVDCKWYTVSVESQGSSGKRNHILNLKKIKVSNWVSIKLIQSQYYLLYVAFVFLHKRCPIESRKPIFIGNRGTGVTKKWQKNGWKYLGSSCVILGLLSKTFNRFLRWVSKVTPQTRFLIGWQSLSFDMIR